MKNSLPLIHRLLIWFIMFACFASGGRANAQDQSARDSVYVAVTVLDKKVLFKPTTPAVIAQNRAQLSPKDFARWQADSRWRPLVSKVSHHVMTDWANRNNVKPTREEIKEHFAKEAKQYLQAYSTPEGKKRVAFAVGWCTATTVEWATAKALHEKYGGRIAISSFGAWVAIEGRNALLKEYAAAGKIRFHDPEIEKEFWVGVDNPAVLDVTLSESKRISSHFARPPWEGWGARTAKLFKETPDLLFGISKDEQDQPTDTEPAKQSVNRSGESGGN